MKRFYTKTGKLILALICIVFSIIFSMGFAACIYLGNWGLFAKDSSEFENTIYRAAGSKYAAWVLSEADSGFTSNRLPAMNCYYGVIDCKEGVSEINDYSKYLYRNFKDIDLPGNAYISTYAIDDNTKFTLSESFFDIGNGDGIESEVDDKYSVYPIEGIGYDLIGRTAYVFANGRFYQLSDTYYVYYEDDADYGTPNTNRIYSKIWEKSKTVSDADPEKLYIDGRAFDPLSDSASGAAMELAGDDGSEGVLSVENIADLSEIHSELRNLRNQVSLEDISSVGIYENDPNADYYTFVCFPNMEKMSSSTYTYDFYAQAKAFINTALGFKYRLPVITLVAFLITILSYIFFLCAAGHKKGEEGIAAGPVENIYTDIAFVGMIILGGLAFALIPAGVELFGKVEIFFSGAMIIAGYLSVMIIGLMWSSNTAVNIKLHRFLKHSLIYRFLQFIKNRFIKIYKEIDKISATVKWTKRIWTIFILVCGIEFLILISADIPGTVILLFVLEKIVVSLILRTVLVSYSKIKSAAMSLANGEIGERVELKGTSGIFKEFADALNDIQKGISIAIEERTKSERMKTELITNVSHDIKTPLTSVINYVDLLGKENIESVRAKEYLEVLDRQSKRLKKLIEDLIEASKISSGNINFNMEKINAVVLLNQSIGEFTDRLEAGGINTVTKFPEKDIYLMADNRYLWRVFDNLMSNIVKYAQPETRAYIELKEDGNKVEYVFRNTSKEELNIPAEELMERFVRGDRSRYTDGNGLGLSIAKSLTEAMGGKMALAIDGDLFKATLVFEKM